ncbi:acyltransferase family protein [Aquabacter sp. P-9]|uniref:acyltransferase family protein n=1 Tax=Aquabacter sediminis TaxID=3029197 RepID=UPI00237DC8AD|nr:acyltransferase family protein [Aquabacter sp. P-9]MDE1569663.1 acyltransferase family protein [Aquabacter sp. P-9]
MVGGTYRTDIDGLRAVAVCLVLLFHAGFPPSGGFIGVDVFFVISGYLITDLILNEARAGTFTFFGFYDRRVRRILPALLVVLVASLAAGALILMPGDFAVLGRSAAYTAVGLANFFFFRHTGYFDGAAELMPLLNMWSLAVEEQFYLAWPLLLLGAVRLARKWPHAVAALFVLVIGLSFALAVVKVAEGAKSAFYQPFGRAWEFAIGGALVLVRDRLAGLPRGAAEGLKFAGVAAILVPALLLDPTSPFPGPNAVSPVLGTALLLLPTRAPTLVAAALSLRPVRFVGQISYSLYLWHWPVLAFTRHYVNGAHLTDLQAIGALAVAFGLAVLSWRFVEQPVRRYRAMPARRVVLSGTLAGLGVAALGFSIYLAEGVANRVSPQLAALGSFERMWNWPCPQRAAVGEGKVLCVAGADWRTATTRGIVWGDSHAEHLMHLLDEAGRRTNTAIALVRACPAVFSREGLRRAPAGLPAICADTYDSTRAMLKAAPDIRLVILASAWNFMPDAIYRAGGKPESMETGYRLLAEELLRVSTDLASPGRKIVLFGDIPHWDTDPMPCLAARDGALLRAPCDREVGRIDRSEISAVQDGVSAAFRSLKGARDDVVVAVPADALCDASGCASHVNGEFLYLDRDHFRRTISPAARARLVEKLGLEALLRSAEPAPASKP